MGYVGLSNAVLLVQNNEVTAFDIDLDRVEKVANKKSPISDADIQSFLENEQLNLTTTDSQEKAFESLDLIVVATPSNYDPDLNYFDVTSVEVCVRQALNTSPNANIVVRSTIPAGWSDVTPYPVDYRTGSFREGVGWNLSGNLNVLRTAIREAVGSAAYWAMGR